MRQTRFGVVPEVVDEPQQYSRHHGFRHRQQVAWRLGLVLLPIWAMTGAEPAAQTGTWTFRRLLF